MQDLRVIGVENGALLVASDDGTRYRIAIDEVMQSKLRKSVPDPSSGRKLSPREIQAHIRSGMSAEEVASTTGVSIEYIQKFEGPVLAEREFIVDSALAVAVHTAIESEPATEGSNFGTVIRERLYDLGATGERWASWKEDGGGWVIKLSFTAEQIDHDARWNFDPKKAALAPVNSEAITLSQQGELAGALIPRLRAVGGEDRTPDSSRFDSGAFTDRELNGSDLEARAGSRLFPASAEGPSRLSPSAINREQPDEAAESNQTADLLEALRRRRGERESANFEDEMSDHPSAGGIHLVDVPLEGFSQGFESINNDEVSGHTAPQPTVLQPKSRKGRASMPSWDDIVFGARPEDDPS